MKSLYESIATAMDSGRNTAIVPFLPYILQDFWEIGTPPPIVIDLIGKHCSGLSNLSILDLGCGKGAVCVKLAQAFGCHCYGIDGIAEFIETAKAKANEYGIDALCRFETEDIRVMINELGRYDVIILGAIGQVFGDYYATLTTLSGHLTGHGIIIINDAYIEDSSTFRHPAILPYREMTEQIDHAGMVLIDESIESSDAYADEFENLQRRCKELIVKYPDKAVLFEEFLRIQAEEYNVLENEVVGSVMVITRKDI